MVDVYLSTVYSVVTHIIWVPIAELTPQRRFSELVECPEKFKEIY